MLRESTHVVLSLAVLAATAAGFPGVGSPAVAAVAACPASVPAAAAALAAASACQGKVEIGADRTETSQSFANPDGSQTLVQTPVPVRIRTADGTWVPVDTTLVRRGDGSVGPRAASVDVRFSGGGTGPLVSLAVSGGSVRLSWAGTLPAPALTADTAVYSEVFPGVDLRMRATAAGYSQVLVVKTAEAAANPALRQVAYSLDTSGESVRAGRLGGIDVLGPDGAVVATSGGASMWDSGPPDVSLGLAQSSSAFVPRDEAATADVAVAVSGSKLLLRPDSRMLDGAATHFPVFIDPALTAPRLRWAYANSTNSNNNDGIARVGLDPGGDGTYRSFFEFDTSRLVGTHILGSTFSTLLTHSWSCGSTPVDLYRTGAIAAGINGTRTGWSPGLVTWLDERSGHAHKPSTGAGCSDDPQPDVAMEFSGQLTTELQTFAANGTAKMTLGLSARRQDGSSESTTDRWKKFSVSDTALSVTFNSYPNTPTGLTVDGKACGTGANQSYVSTVGGHNPVLKATLSDPDAPDHLTGTFSWTTNTGTATASQANIANGQTVQVTTSAASFTPGTTYSYSVSSYDGRDTSKSAGGPCEFTVDNTPPGTAAVVSKDGRYPPGDSSGFHDGVGKTGTFTFSPNGSADVVAYRYGLTDPPASTVNAVADGTATVGITPPAPGINDLYVRGVDRAGNLGPTVDYRFLVGNGSDPVAVWNIDAGTGTTLADTGAGTGSPAVKHPMTLATGTAWTAGRVVGGHSVNFNGTTGYASTTAPVLNTTLSFSVSAWVRLTSTAKWGSVFSQDGTTNAAFDLQYGADNGTWTFDMYSADNGSPTTTRARSTSPAKPNLWSHLVAVYDVGTHQMRLYVDGTQVGAATFTTTWAANGPFEIGRVKWLNGGPYVNYFPGDIADIQTWDRVLEPDEIAALAQPTLVAQWDLDDGTGTTAHDTVGSHDATVAGGTAWTFAGHNDILTGDPGALSFDGSTGYAATAGPVLLTNQSFTVTAWVKLSASGGGDIQMIAVQEGAHAHPFRLGYSRASNSFNWRTVTGDVDNAAGSTITGGQGVPDKWTFLTGVWDAAAGQMRLYVDGVLVRQAATGNPFAATGVVDLGRDWINTTHTEYFSGQIDDVRMYQGALSDQAISSLFNQ
jgi:hypothetical protein